MVTLILTDPLAVHSGAFRVITAVVPVFALVITWMLACLRWLPGQRRRERRLTKGSTVHDN